MQLHYVNRIEWPTHLARNPSSARHRQPTKLQSHLSCNAPSDKSRAGPKTICACEYFLDYCLGFLAVTNSDDPPCGSPSVVKRCRLFR